MQKRSFGRGRKEHRKQEEMGTGREKKGHEKGRDGASDEGKKRSKKGFSGLVFEKWGIPFWPKGYTLSAYTLYPLK